MDRQMNRWTDGWTNGHTFGQVDKSTDIWMDNRRTGRWTDEWMDGWTDGQINGAPFSQWPYFLVTLMMLLGCVRRAEWQRHRLCPSMGHGDSRAGGG